MDEEPKLIETDPTEHIQALFLRGLKLYAVDGKTGEPRSAVDVVRMTMMTLARNGYTAQQIRVALAAPAVREITDANV